jgi:hypothetical protein
VLFFIHGALGYVGRSNKCLYSRESIVFVGGQVLAISTDEYRKILLEAELLMVNYIFKFECCLLRQ